MSFNYRVAGYVKLAKLWEKNKEVALSYHKRYYKEKCDKIPGMDITRCICRYYRTKVNI